MKEDENTKHLSSLSITHIITNRETFPGRGRRFGSAFLALPACAASCASGRRNCTILCLSVWVTFYPGGQGGDGGEHIPASRGRERAGRWCAASSIAVSSGWGGGSWSTCLAIVASIATLHGEGHMASSCCRFGGETDFCRILVLVLVLRRY